MNFVSTNRHMLEWQWDGNSVSCLMFLFQGTQRLRREECRCLSKLIDKVTMGKGSGMHLFDLWSGRRKCESSSGAKSGQVSLPISFMPYSSHLISVDEFWFHWETELGHRALCSKVHIKVRFNDNEKSVALDQKQAVNLDLLKDVGTESFIRQTPWSKGGWVLKTSSNPEQVKEDPT